MKRAPPHLGCHRFDGQDCASAGDDSMAQLRACSLSERTDRLECLDKLSRAVATVAPLAPKEGRSIVSQTRSPVDHSPIATATI
jgi:hypothetical protein